MNPTKTRLAAAIGAALLGIAPMATLAQTYTRVDTTTYQDDTSNWILGQVRTHASTGVLRDNATASVETDRTDYDGRGLPWKTYRFGKLQQTITYNADGTVATVADGNGNVTTLSNWKRGVPQLITFADQATKSASVNDDGTIAWVKDELGNATCYGYDAMGRVNGIRYPSESTLGTCGTDKWAATTISYSIVSADEYGIPAGHWRRMEDTGTYHKTVYYDALLRPLVESEYDTTDVAGTQRWVAKRYNEEGRLTFTSYPKNEFQTAGVTWPGVSDGTRTSYDALGRVIRIEQDSELGVLATTTEYLPGLRVRVTNPRGLQTTSKFQAFDEPGYDQLVRSDMPENAVVEITRNSLGMPFSIRRRSADGSVSSTRQYVYDGYEQLCKSIEPETGATVNHFDGAGNLQWSASGLSLLSTTSCNDADAAASGRAVTRTYSPRNRMATLRFPDGQGDQDWFYTRDGLPDTVVTRNEAGSPPVTNTYVYNARRLLTGETQSHDINQWSVGYGYDAGANLASMSYPAGLSVTYSPNALGQPTQVVGNGSLYASGIRYYPNGAMKQFTFGNGIVHTMAQNARQLPSTVANGSVLNYQYNYDANGNVETIYDNARGSSYSRWMHYDGLDRLYEAGSASFGGDSWHRFTYDALDNITSWKLAGVKDYANYYYNPGNNRLENIRNSSGATTIGIGYDTQGNVANKNGALYAFDFGNRLRAALGTERYRYDAYGRRVLTASSNVNSYALYGRDGQLLWERDERAGARLQYVYLNGTILATRRRPIGSDVETVYYNHNDALGSLVALTDQTGAIAQRSDYDPFGTLINRAANNRPAYTGHVQDAQTGLTYMQQRYYDPQIGRFLSVDPVTASAKTGGNFNRYWYANNNPYKFLDPDGRYVCTAGPNECKSFSGAIEAGRSAAAKLPANERKIVDRALNFYGKEGQDNGVKITGFAESKDAGGSAVKDGKTVTINIDFQKLSQDAKPGSQAYNQTLSAYLVHEGNHGVDQSRWGNSRTTETVNWAEKRAYTAQALFYKGAGLNGSDPYGFVRTNGSLNGDQIERYADGSTAGWLEQK